MSSTELTIIPSRADNFLMPAISIQQAVQRRQIIVDFTRQVMVKDSDYGTIPGTQKDTLYKPGAEKLCNLFGLTPRFELVEAVYDWTGEGHNGEPFFYFLYRCYLERDGYLWASSDGSCNSWESKYRYRKAQRTCPSCGIAAIIRGKAEYGGGWLCFQKKAGCGAKYPDGDLRIESQPVGNVPNTDVADTVNTLQKMATKRALVATCLLAVNASEFFTQDLESEEAGHTPDAPQTSASATHSRSAPERDAQTGNEPDDAFERAHSEAFPDAPLPPKEVDPIIAVKIEVNNLLIRLGKPPRDKPPSWGGKRWGLVMLDLIPMGIEEWEALRGALTRLCDLCFEKSGYDGSLALLNAVNAAIGYGADSLGDLTDKQLKDTITWLKSGKLPAINAEVVEESEVGHV